MRQFLSHSLLMALGTSKDGKPYINKYSEAQVFSMS